MILIPIKTKSFIFRDNMSIVDSSINFYAKTHKRHVTLSFHYIREAIAVKIIEYYFINREINSDNSLSKY